MSKFKIGDKVVFSTPPDDGIGVVIGFDVDCDPCVEWPDAIGDYYDSQLVLYDPDSWQDFEERIKERIV